jgi:hypothetical protein
MMTEANMIVWQGECLHCILSLGECGMDAKCPWMLTTPRSMALFLHRGIDYEI